MKAKHLLVSLVFSVVFLTIFSYKTEALVIDNVEYDVQIEVLKDSSMIVRERIVNEVDGEFTGLRRDIPLFLNQACEINPQATCGGFDKLIPLAVYDLEGRRLDSSQYSTYIFENEDSGDRYFRFEKQIFQRAQQVSNEKFGWIVEYRLFGAIGVIRGEQYYYWNSFPERRTTNSSSPTKEASLSIRFPEGVLIDMERLELYDQFFSNSENISGNEMNFSFNNLPQGINFTIAYKFETGEIDIPGTIDYKVIAPQFGLRIYLDGIEIENDNEKIIDYIPTGKREITFAKDGYESETFTVDVKSGGITELVIDLEPQPFTQFMLFLNTLFVIIAPVLVFGGLLISYLIYRRKGRDQNKVKTIIPLFEPPKGVHPYLLGSLKDEKVDKVDITGSIIDLAYRGYLKIQELTKGKNYKLIKKKDFSSDQELTPNEKYLLESLFNGKEEVETKNLASTFPLKFLKLQGKVYDELVSRGYFEVSPEKTRNLYVGAGLGIMFVGGGIFIFLLLILSELIGYLFFFTPGLGLMALGIGILIIANYMPAKTSLGSEVFAEILGFKMYLHTAERFRLQKLGPDEFERYLSYAIVFGIEKEWAEKFKDIYNRIPDWYEGSSTGVWDAIWISSLVRSFSDSTAVNITPVSSSGSASGGGWSSGGSFGGFSGGGGGGGSSGGW